MAYRKRGDRAAIKPLRGFYAVENAAKRLRLDVQWTVLSPEQAAERLKADLRQRGVLRDDA